MHCIRKMQDQFDSLDIDLQEANKRENPKQCGPNRYWFSHFDYAYKGIKQDPSGKALHDILDAIKSTWPNDKEIDQGVFIGLWQLNNWSKEMCIAVNLRETDPPIIKPNKREIKCEIIKTEILTIIFHPLCTF